MNASRQIRFWLVGAVVFLVAVYVLKSVLLPFLLGMAIAYFFDPVCDRLEEFGWSRTLATSVVTAVFVVLLVLLFVLVLPAMVAQLIELMNEVPIYLESLREAVNAWIARMRLETDPVFFEKLRESLSGSAGQIATWATGAVGDLLAGGLAVDHAVPAALAGLARRAGAGAHRFHPDRSGLTGHHAPLLFYHGRLSVARIATAPMMRSAVGCGISPTRVIR